jgi:hypothetical protein
LTDWCLTPSLAVFQLFIKMGVERHMFFRQRQYLIIFFITEAIANMDDDFIMLEIYDDTQSELQAKNKILEKEKEKVCIKIPKLKLQCNLN